MTMKTRKNLTAFAWFAMLVAVIVIATIDPALAGNSGR